jgi:hypothetical protein
MSTTRDQTKRLCPAGNKNDTKTRIGVASDSEARIRNVTIRLLVGTTSPTEPRICVPRRQCSGRRDGVDDRPSYNGGRLTDDDGENN